MLNVVLLIAIITIIFMVVILTVSVFLGFSGSLRNRFFLAFKLDPNLGLIKQGPLWICIATPIALGFYFGYWSWIDRDLDLSENGYNEFLKISTLPLAIMAISLPLSSLVSKLHSTHQTAKQIFIASFKNNIDAFFAHRKSMLEYFTNFEDAKYFNEFIFEYKIHPVLHKRFFNGSPEDGWPEKEYNTFNLVESHLRNAAHFLLKVLENSSDNRLKDYVQASTFIYHAAEVLHIKQVYHEIAQRGVYFKTPSDEGGYITIGEKTLETLAALRFTREFYNNFCDFSGQARLQLEKKIEAVFEKTDYWLQKGDFIKEIHSYEIENLVNEGKAEYCEKHQKNIQHKISN